MKWPAADPTSPYFCHGPTLISFSGGRTSAYMLYMVLCAHGGVLPPYVYVVFCNTGKERIETLRFVYECGNRWGVHIWWLERSDGDCARATPSERFNVVGFNSASRIGEPFSALIKKRGFLPNAVTRFCTQELKIRVMKHFMLSMGHETWTNMVGLRADERKRVMKQVLNNAQGKQWWNSYCPLALAGVVERIVWRFWLGRNNDPRKLEYYLPQGFDLGLRRYEGNCDGCFLKGYEILCQSEREQPGTLAWWAEEEAGITELKGRPQTARFVTEYTYAALADIAQRTPPIADLESLRPVGDCTASCAVDDDDEPEPDDEAMAWMLSYMERLWREGPPPLTPAMKQDAAMGDLFEVGA
ncbi:hypothetical protein PX699_13440 [Sphingobium sp. H39-3-25]|uniref:hypothetical protein n=1 Tax=Sphingobium arseniciresistens TaxID=3030834 RepID=UPI0023BA04C4|nr:hypothetical protein [Sphingobium arseniciresistens]